MTRGTSGDLVGSKLKLLRAAPSAGTPAAARPRALTEDLTPGFRRFAVRSGALYTESRKSYGLTPEIYG